MTPYIGAVAQTPIALGVVTATTVTGLTNGTTYTFTVFATNAIDAGPASAASNAVTPTAAPTAPGVTTIDDRDAGFRKVGRGWISKKFGHGGRHYVVPVRANSTKRRAVWRAVISEPGTYRVQVMIPNTARLTCNARYVIKTTSGIVTAKRNQAKNRGQWIPLGTVLLEAATFVRLGDMTGEGARGRRRVAFDAVRLIRVDGPSALPSAPRPDPTPAPEPSDAATLEPSIEATAAPE